MKFSFLFRLLMPLLVVLQLLVAPHLACCKGLPKTEKDNAVQAQMNNVMYHFADSIAVHIQTLTGSFVPTGTNPFPVFDDKSSFQIRIAEARIVVRPDAIASVLNTFVFVRKDAPLKDIAITIENNRLKVKGKLHSKGDIPFETLGSLSTTPDGKLRLHSEKVSALHLPVKGLMDLFGIEVADLINTNKIEGLRAEKDDLILDLEKLLPPPHLQGAVTAVNLENNSIVTVFGVRESSSPPSPVSGNYMIFKGNQLRFGKLTMDDVDLTLLDLDPADPLDFYLDRYKDQLVPGYSKITPSFGLRAFLKDFEKVRASTKSTPQKH